jgi:hypothetical protein
MKLYNVRLVFPKGKGVVCLDVFARSAKAARRIVRSQRKGQRFSKLEVRRPRFSPVVANA